MSVSVVCCNSIVSVFDCDRVVMLLGCELLGELFFLGRDRDEDRDRSLDGDVVSICVDVSSCVILFEAVSVWFKFMVCVGSVDVFCVFFFAVVLIGLFGKRDGVLDFEVLEFVNMLEKVFVMLLLGYLTLNRSRASKYEIFSTVLIR